MWQVDRDLSLNNGPVAQGLAKGAIFCAVYAAVMYAAYVYYAQLSAARRRAA